MIATATVARTLSRTLGGDWREEHRCEHFDRAYEEWTVWTNGEREVSDPRESTDVCLEMLHAAGYDLVPGDGEWRLLGHDKGVLLLPISGQPFRDAVIRLSAGEE